MPSFIYNTAMKEMIDGILDLDSDTLKIMLVNDDYTPNKDDDVVDAGGAADAVDAEIVATNYARGWGAAGRKVATISVAVDKVNDRAKATITDLTWAALGGAVNDVIAGAILVKEGGANDTTSRLIAFFDVADTPTNGGDIKLDFDEVLGNIWFST
jgi:hypothetical protein